MFKKDSILYSINIISKFMGLICVFISLILVNVPALIVLSSIALVIISYEFENIFKFSIIGLIISVIGSFYNPVMWLSKILILINYLLLLKKITKGVELRYMLEVTLYKFQSKRITFRVLYIIYFFKILRKNIGRINKLREEYGIIKNSSFMKFSLKKAYIRTKNEISELMIINELRFYNYFNSRTYIEKPTWENWDNAYLLCHLLLLVFICVYGR